MEDPTKNIGNVGVNSSEMGGEVVAEGISEEISLPVEQSQSPEEVAEARQGEITKLANSVETTQSRIDEVRERLGVPHTEEDPHSIAMEKARLEELKEQEWQELLASGEERAAEFVSRHPNIPEVIESEPEIAEFEGMIDSFEAGNSLEELRSIIEPTPELYALISYEKDMSVEQIESAVTTISPEEAEQYRLRSKARKDLIPITEKYRALKRGTDKYEELKMRYQNISRAVGMINGGKVDHTR